MKPEVNQILNQIKTTWHELATKAIFDTISSNQEQNFYAGAFWLFYVDYTVIFPPCFGINSEEELLKTGEDDRWYPTEWKFDILSDTTEKMMPIYEKLSSLIEEEPDKTWDEVIESHKSIIAELTLKITEDYHKGNGVFSKIKRNDDFVVGIFEERDGEEEFVRLLQMSINQKRIERLKNPTLHKD